MHRRAEEREREARVLKIELKDLNHA